MTRLTIVRMLAINLGLLSALPAAAFALPMTQSASDTVDDALIVLEVLEEHLRGDNRSWCELRVNVRGSDVNFSAGDEVFLWVYENDLAGDEELWATSFTVTAAEVTAQLVDRTLDCTSDFGSDIGGNLEIYAQARVEKSLCGSFCVFDRPETRELDVMEVDDDSAEMDDTAESASRLSPDVTVVRRSFDADFHLVELPGPGAIDLSAFYRPNSGLLNVDILDSTGTLIVRADARASGAGVTTGALARGTYYVRVAPQGPPDYQFYDLLVSLSSASCAPGAEERRICDLCGTETRTCAGGIWAAWSECMDQGECTADETDTRGCGVGGTEMRTCSGTCEWGEFGMCMGMNTDPDAGAEPERDAGRNRDAGIPGPGDSISGFDGGRDRDAGRAPISTDSGCAAVQPDATSTFAFLLMSLVVVGLRRRRS